MPYIVMTALAMLLGLLAVLVAGIVWAALRAGGRYDAEVDSEPFDELILDDEPSIALQPRRDEPRAMRAPISPETAARLGDYNMHGGG